MLLELKNKDKETLYKLLDFAEQNHIDPSLIETETAAALPGAPLNDNQLREDH